MSPSTPSTPSTSPTSSTSSVTAARTGPPAVAEGGGGTDGADELFVFPASTAQRRLWFLDRLSPGLPVYDIPWALSLDGPLAPARLAAALEELVGRHEALRTTFRTLAGELQQVIAPELRLPLPVVDLSGLPSAAREGELGDQVALHARHRFDLARGPLVSVRLVRVAPRSHVLLANLHHTVGDGWSVQILVEEMTVLYRGLGEGGRSDPGEPLAPVAVQYADFAQAQADWLAGERLERELDDWRRTLGDVEPLPLPLDRPRRLDTGAPGARRQRSLPAAVGRGVERLAAGGASFFMVALAALQVLLARITGRDDVTVGTVTSGRHHPSVERTVGCFVDALALRVDLSGRPTFAQALERVRRVFLEAVEHQAVPFDLLVEELRPERELGRTPFFDVVLRVDETRGRRVLDLGELEVSSLATTTGTAKFDWSVALSRPGDEGGDAPLALSLSYRADRFDATTAERTLDQLARLLDAAVAAPETPVDRLPLLGPAEHHQLLREWGAGTPGDDLATALGAPGARTLDALVLARAALDPSATALVMPGPDGDERRVTAGELAERISAIAARLAATGLAPEEVVAVAVERSPDLPAALLGVARAGGAFLPLDLADPPARRAFVLADAAVRRVVVDSPDAAVVAELPDGVEAVALDGIGGIGQAAPGAPTPAASQDGDRLAYVLYTSGSTGRPKGTLMSHRAIVGTLAWLARRFPAGPDDRELAKTAVSFDVSIQELFTPLVAGVPLVLARPGEAADPARLARRIEASGVTSVHFVPTLLAAWADEVEAGSAGVGRLRRIVSGGEVLPPELARRSAALLGPGGELFVQYGLTETAVTVTAHRRGARRSDAGAELPLALGHPGDGVRAVVADPWLRPVPPGVVGEIAIGGAPGDGPGEGDPGAAPLGRGYLGRPAATAERFVPDPWSPGPGGGRLYRTGDLGRWGADGRLEFVGRLDQQLEIRGVRVEPGEVEAVLEEHPAVSRVVAVGVRGRLGVLVVPAGSGGTVDRQELLRFAAQRLPAPMVPSLVLVTAGSDAAHELPRTASGKVDRRAVTARLAAELDTAGGAGGLGSGAADAGSRAPSGALETAVLAVWRQLLERDDLGVEDDFFAVGGHSLLATRLVSSLRRLVGRDLSLAEVFENPTVAAQARRLEDAPGVAADWAIPRLDRPEGDRGESFEAPVSFAQRRLWFLDRLAPGNPFYDMFGAVRLVGPLEPCRLATAFAALAARHEPLRTTFAAEGGSGGDGPVQVVAPAAGSAPPLPVVDLTAVAEARGRERADRELARLAHREGRRPFDLARGPLIRLTLLRLAPGDHTLFTNLHHIVSDGWSQGVLVREVEALYRGRTLEPLALQYADFAAWQRQLLEGEPLARLLERWRRRLEGLPGALALPFDRPRPAVDRFRGGARRFRLDETTTSELTTLARGAGATLSMALLAAFQAVLGRAAGADDLAVGVAVANRTRSEIEPLIGFFVNTLVIRSRLGGAGLAELVTRVRDESVGAFADQDLPFELLVEELAPERSLGRNPLVQVMYGFQSFPEAEPAAGELRIEAPTARLEDSGSSKFDLTLFVSESDGRLEGVFQYNRDLFDGVTVERLGRRLGALVAAGLERPKRPVMALDLLTAAERHQLTAELGSAPGPNDPRIERGLAALVADGALRHTERRAVEEADGPGALTYGELVRRAGRLAALLGEAGVGPGDRVALAVPRSADLVVAMVGIVAVGAAYLPLDPDYPAERTRFMVADSGARALVAGAGLEELAPELPCLRVPEDGSADGGDGGDGGGGRDGALPAGGLGGDAAAYVIYTSGSTGTPKGVEVSHRAVARLAFDRWLVEPGDRVAQAASASFDAITYEVWGALAVGGTVVVVSRRQALDPAVLEGVLAERRVDRLFLTTALFNQVVRDRPRAFAPLAGLLFGGEAVDPTAVARVLAEAADGGAPAALHHVYGPTETTTFASRWTVDRVAPGAWTVPIGGAVASTSLYVVDRRLEPVPLGVVGELLVGGAGLAHGYLGRPAATAERFVPDPLTSGTGEEPGSRLYRTGDLVRRRQDGALQFVGRVDHQVKLRGHRIELGEVESALLSHPAVAAAVALVREDVPGDRRLVAYVAQDPDWSPEAAGETTEAGDVVEDWSSIFDDLYQRDAVVAREEPGFNIAGWDSTYTGLPLPAEQMRVWLDDTLGAIRAVTPPGSRVLELGSGTGLLLLALAPEAALYVGTDVSAEAVATVAAQTADLPQVRLFERAADQFEGLEELVSDDGGTGFDTVVLNSVVQYFPTPEYLARVLEGAARLLAPGGSIFVGDVRSLPLLPAFQADVALEQAAGDASLEAVRAAYETRRLDEGELAVAPAFFAAVARRTGLGRVEVFPKAGAHHDELTGFRYQVVLRDAPPATDPGAEDLAVERLDGWTTAWTADALAAFLEGETTADAVVVRGLANARTARAVAALRGLGSLDAAGRGPGGAATAAALRRWLERRVARARATEAVDPHELAGIGRRGGWDVALGWAEPGAEGRFDAAFVRRSAGDRAVDPRDLLPSVEVPRGEPPERHANRPLASRFARRVAPLLSAHLAERLPAYMVPGDFVALAELPLTPNGKVDRRRLPAPDRQVAGAAADGGSAPRGPVEEVVAAVLADLLGLEGIGAEADFFDLGGHSLLATQAISRLRRELGVELPLAVLFENPTPRALAAAVAARTGQSTADAAAPPLVPVPDRGPEAPLTYAQERLWFLAALDPSAGRYNESSPLSVAGELSLAALEAAVHRVVERHEALRTVFPQAGEPPRPVQRVLPAGSARLGLPVVDLSGLSAGEAELGETEARRLGGLLRELPFDLHRGPLARLVALRLGPRDHALFLGFHHIVFDGWSRSVFAREVSALYRRETTGEPAELPELPVQMADFALWQRGWLTGDVMAAQIDHWRRELAHLPALDLPTDRPRGRYRMPRGASVPLVVDGELAGRLARLGRRRGATLFMVLTAAVQALLGRWSGQDDFALGTPVAQRTREEIEPLVGFFVNMLVLRADLRGDPPFEQLVERVRERALAAYSHQDVPFEKLVEELSPARDPGRNPLFQASFQLYNAPAADLDLGQARVGGSGGAGRGAKWDLELSLVDTDRGDDDGPRPDLAGQILYDTGLFDRRTVETLAAALGDLLAAAAERPGERLSALAAPASDELARLLDEGSGERSDYAAETGLHELVAARAEADPGAVAVAMAGGAGLTYGELMAAARELAGRLRAAGVEPGDRVGLAVERSPRMVVAMVAILRAGAAYVPLDPAYPAERLAWMANDSGLAALVHDRTGRPVAESVEVASIDLDSMVSEDEAPEPISPVPPGGDALAYVVYTSGSTGRPKGVAVSHRAVARLVTGADYVTLGPDDRVGQMATASFDATTWEVWGPLAAGGRTVILPRRVALEPQHLGAVLRDEGVTALFVTTALFDRLVAEAPGIFSSLEHLLFGGEAVDPDTVARLLADRPPRRLVHVYGPTEATTFATWHQVQEVPSAATTVPIGRPIANTRALVLDRRGALEPVPERAVGELLLGGPGLARGYLGRPAATAAAFVPDPFAATPGERLYRTGDLVRRDGAGRIEFVGRLDAQVKVRGFRVEPGEIEARLASHPAVERGAVVVSAPPGEDGAPRDARLVAYLVPAEPGARPEQLVAAAREHCERTLPPHLMPAAFGVVDALPLTPNGKLDRSALGRLATLETTAGAGAGGGGAAGAPTSPTEEILARLFAEVVGTMPERGGDFFDLGGHSLSAIQLVSRVRGAFGVEVPLVDLFEHPTVAAFARRIEAALAADLAGEAGVAEAPPLVAAADDERPGPLSFAQERLWIIDQMEPGQSLYNMPLAVTLDGDLDAAALARAAAELIRRHGALRTSFEWLDGRPVQRIEPFDGLDLGWEPGLPLIDLSALPEVRRPPEAGRLRRAEAAAPFDLELGPVARLKLVRSGPRRHLLTATLHHIVSDGWSLGVVERELAVLYAHYQGGGAGPLPLPELPVQYPDYARWQRQWLSGEVLERHLDHWRRALADVRDLELPTDRPASGPPRADGGMVTVTLEPGVAEGLEALARRSGATPFMALLALWQTLLARSSGQWGFAVGTPVANRTRQEIEGLIGFFVNTLVLAAAVRPDDDVARALERVRAVTLDAFAHQEMPFQKLVAELVGDRKLERTPLFQTLFALQNAPRKAAEMPGLELTGAGGGVPRAHFDLSLELEATGDGGFAGSLTYRQSLFDRTTALGLARRFETLARGVLARPEVPLARLPLLAAAERHQIVVEVNDTGLAATSDLPVHERFLEQAARRPGAVALQFGAPADPADRAGTVTYGELAERSETLARRLVALEVGPDDRVALALGREVAMVVALIAVLRAGAAYVPLDLEAPRERLERIVAEAAPRLLVVRDDDDPGSWDVPAGCRVLGVDGDGLPQMPQGSDEVPDTSGAVPDRLPEPPSLLALAVLYYTSGSTGVPKGVGQTHLGLARLLDSQRRFGYGPDDAVASATRFSFDVSNLDLWSALAHGGRLVLVALDDVLDPDAFAARVRRTGVTVLAASAALLSRLVRETPDLLGEMRLVSTGGEAADPVAVERILHGPPSHRPENFLNAYGPTEATTDAVDCPLVGVAREPRVPASFVPPVPLPPPGKARPVPIGRPLPETIALVVDRHLEPVPPGVEGELLVGGPGLARGYLGQPAETARAFVPDFTGLGGPGGRLYRTRDLVRRRRAPRDEAGLLDFVGRVDHQVKLRGFRIELGEVELVLLDHPAVDRAVAVLWSGAPDGAAEIPDSPPDRKHLVAYVVPASADVEVDVGALRSHCRERLPDYMVPTYVVAVAELPVTANDKVDRDALPPPRTEDLGLDRSQGPRTPLEETLVELWREILGVTPGVHDDFFAAGGHSLSAIQVISRLRGALGVELEIRTLFEHPTVAGLARVVAGLEGGFEGGEAAARSPLAPARSGSLELSFAQERLWLLDRMGGTGSGAVYNMPMAVTLDGDLDVAALGGAVLDLVRRHEPLRTRFVAPEGTARAVQQIAPAEEIPAPGAGRLAVVDLTGLSPSRVHGEVDEGGELARLVAAESARPFDLARDRPVRTELVRLDPGRSVLLLNMHHIVSDGWSMGLVRRDVAELYAARREGRAPVLPPLSVQAADHAAWERARFGGEHRQRALAWWRETLDGTEPLELPTDRPRRRVPSTAGAMARIPLPPAAGAMLEELSDRFRATPFMVLATVWKAVLARWTGQWDVALGTPVANRHRTEIENLVGFFVNSVVLRSRLAPERSWAHALAIVRETTLGAFAHQEVPFQVLVQELAPDRGLQRSPFFQVMLAYQNAPDSDAELPGVALGSLPAQSRTSRYEMTVSFDAGRHLAGSVEYRSELFDPSTVERLGRRFARALRAVAAEPDQSLAELPLLGAGERYQVVVGWNDTAALALPAEVEETAHGLVLAQAARRPEATALVDLSAAEARTVSYGDLARRVEELATELRRAGVGLETPVGVLLPASVELVVAQLAVLAAGGAYVPLAVDDPVERLARVTRDVGARLVLTTGAWAEASPGADGVTVWDLDRLGDRPDTWAQPRLDPAPATPAGPDSLAYVMYTSGSTGAPKGVEVSHRGIVRLVSPHLQGARAAPELAVGPDDRLLLAAPVTFDASTFELWGALARGASLVIPPAEPSLETLGRTVREAGVSVLWITSGLFALMVDRRLDDLRHLRILLTGGDVMPEAQARRFRAAVPGCLLVNCYGPTENTTFTTTHPVEGGAAPGAMPIGRAIPGTTVVVADPWLRPVPAGTRGELVTGGPGVARGYRGRPAETARHFVPDPWGARHGARLYRTGDLVRALSDGRLEFVGRLDDQVKIRGFRIEPDEVRVVLERLPQVAEAVVVVAADRRGDRELVAYVVADDDAAGDGADADPLEARLAEELARRLPRHLLPSAIVVLEHLPLTRHGKLDRQALPAPRQVPGEAGAERTSAARYTPPRTAMERQIAGLWEELLEVERVGVHDSFFDLGGHSLALLEATSRLGALLGRELPGRLMFEHPTVAALAAALEADTDSGGTGEDAGGGTAVAAGRDRGAARRAALGRRRGSARTTDGDGDDERDDHRDDGDEETQ